MAESSLVIMAWRVVLASMLAIVQSGHAASIPTARRSPISLPASTTEVNAVTSPAGMGSAASVAPAAVGSATATAAGIVHTQPSNQHPRPTLHSEVMSSTTAGSSSLARISAGVAVGIAIAIGLILAAVFLVLTYAKTSQALKCRLKKPAPRTTPSVQQAARSIAVNIANMAGSHLKVIDSAALTIGARMRRSQYANVHRATLNNDTKLGGARAVAVKMLKSYSTDVKDARRLLDELGILQVLQHEHISKLHFGGLLEGHPCLVLEHFDGGDLHEYLSQLKDSSLLFAPELDVLLHPHEVLEICLQVCRALDYLARKKIVHRDIAARNVLVREMPDKSLQVKLADFDMARTLPDKGVYKCQPVARRISSRTSISPHDQSQLGIKWMAMESIRDGVFTTMTDVWSFGVLFWEVATYGEVPYGSIANWRLLEHLETGQRLPQPHGTTGEQFRMMTFCWHKDPQDRPTFEELLNIMTEAISREKNYLSYVEDLASGDNWEAVQSGNDSEAVHDGPHVDDSGFSEWFLREEAARTTLCSGQRPLDELPLTAKFSHEQLPDETPTTTVHSHRRLSLEVSLQSGVPVEPQEAWIDYCIPEEGFA